MRTPTSLRRTGAAAVLVATFGSFALFAPVITLRAQSTLDAVRIVGGCASRYLERFDDIGTLADPEWNACGR